MKRFRDTKYLITEDGEVWSEHRNRFLTPTIARHGYMYIYLGVKNKFTIHRLVAEVYCMGYNPKLEVNHKDGNKLNNHFTNLEWVTRSQNMQHSYDIGLTPRTGKNPVRGSKNYRALLKEEQVLEIRELYSSNNYTQKELGIKFNVSRSAICAIILKTNWNHLEVKEKENG